MSVYTLALFSNIFDISYRAAAASHLLQMTRKLQLQAENAKDSRPRAEFIKCHHIEKWPWDLHKDASVPSWMWPWGRRGTSVWRKSCPAPKPRSSWESSEVHLLPHPPMHDSEVANMCVQKTNLFCKVYSREYAFKKWNLAGHQEIRCAVEGHQMKNLIISLGCRGTWDWVISHLLKKNPYTSQNLKTDIHGELTESSLWGFLETLRWVQTAQAQPWYCLFIPTERHVLISHDKKMGEKKRKKKRNLKKIRWFIRLHSQLPLPQNITPKGQL